MRAEQPSGIAQAKPGLTEQLGIDADLPGHHQPRRERAGLAHHVGLRGPGQLIPSVGAADPGLAGPSCLCGRCTGSAVGGVHRSQIAFDDDRVVVIEHQRRRHHGTCAACASIASTARRYSPASQSLAKCR